MPTATQERVERARESTNTKNAQVQINPAPTKTPTGGATSGKSGAVTQAQPSTINSNPGIKRPPTAKKPTVKKPAPKNAAAPTLSNGDLTTVLTNEANIATTEYAAGEAAQSQADTAAANAANGNAGSTTDTGTSSTSGSTSSSGGLSGLLSNVTGGSGKTILIAALVGGAAWYLYRRNKEGKSPFGSK